MHGVYTYSSVKNLSMHYPVICTAQNIPSNMVTMDDIPSGAEAKNRYGNVLPSKECTTINVRRRGM